MRNNILTCTNSSDKLINQLLSNFNQLLIAHLARLKSETEIATDLHAAKVHTKDLLPLFSTRNQWREHQAARKEGKEMDEAHLLGMGTAISC